MAISNDLFLAILAMDSYNRGYNAGLGDPQTGLTGTQIGTATVRTDALPSGYQAASFFAQAYTLSNGQTVISYRGTDTFGESNLDVTTGWPIAFGSYSVEQAQLAA